MNILRNWDPNQGTAQGVVESEVRNINTSEGTLETMVSNRDIDRYESIILPRGIKKHIHRYEANPVFCWQHDLNRVLGRSERVWLRSNESEVWSLFRFDLKSRFSANIFRMYAEKFLRAFSPRTRAHKMFFAWEAPRDLAPLEEIDAEAYEHLIEGRCRYVITEHEYLELSGCTVPGNSGALLQRALSEGAIDREFAAEMMGRIVPTHSPVNFERKEADEVTPEQQKEIVDAVVARVAEIIPKPVEATELVVEERSLSDKEKEEIGEIARQAALDVIVEVLSQNEE